MAPHSCILAWRIPGTGEPGGLPSMGSHRVGHDWSDLAAAANKTGHSDRWWWGTNLGGKVDGSIFSQARELTVFSLLRLKHFILKIKTLVLIFWVLTFYLKGTILILMDNSAVYNFYGKRVFSPVFNENWFK